MTAYQRHRFFLVVFSVRKEKKRKKSALGTVTLNFIMIQGKLA